jgi:methylmalonyl-CoA/ethylmalonyl-CoA epimerase
LTVASADTNDATRAPTIFGREIVHVGYSVASIPRTVDFLVQSLGAGPFFLMEDIRIPVLKDADGRPIVWEHSAAFGQCGNVNIELQETDRLEPATAFGPTYERTEQFNHVAYLAEDLDAESERLEAMGLPMLFAGENGPHRSFLFDAPLLGHTIEIHQDFPVFVEFRAEMIEAAKDWDGSDPLRPVRAELQGGPGGNEG